MKKSKKKFNTTEYTYYKYDPATKRDVPVKIVAGQNGVTEEYITMLREMDEANRIADEREERHRDKGFEAKKNRAALNDDGTAYDDSSLPGNRSIRLGEIMYMGKKDYTEVNLFVTSLSLHTFICGAPGSGKSNTVYKLMYELCRLSTKPERDGDYGNVKFLVIEPAKGEYKYEFGKMPNINIFTTKSGLCEMLCI